MSNAARLETPGSGDDNKLVAYDEGGDALVLTSSPSVSSLSIGVTSSDTITRGGSATWKDLTGKVEARTTGGTSPTLGPFRGGNVQEFYFDTGDYAWITYHVPHDHAPGTDLWLHPHWGHNGTSVTGSTTLTFTYSLLYAKASFGSNSGTAYPAEITITQNITGITIANAPQYCHRVDEVQISAAGGAGGLLDTDDIEPDGLILVAVNLPTQPTWTGGTPSTATFVFEIDLHYQTSSGASGTPNRTPGFY